MSSFTPKRTAYISLALILGVVLGWTARGIADRESEALPTEEETHAATEHESGNGIRAPAGSGDSQAHSSAPPASEPPASRDRPIETEFAMQQETPTTPLTPPDTLERRAIPVSDAHAGIIYSQSTRDEQTGERRAVRDVLESEPKDDSWSYFMEQTLQLFISGHAEADKFSIFHIECRTTICEIQAIGFDPQPIASAR